MAAKSVNVYKRCGCQDPATGRKLGKSCPKLRRRNGTWSPTHGSWQYRLDLPPDTGGRRNELRRGGFRSQDEAQDAVDAVTLLLSIPEPDDTDGIRLVNQMVVEGTNRGSVLPSYDEARRRVVTGRTARADLTVSEWLDHWLREKAKLRAPKTLLSYESHVRLYLRPNLGHLRLDRLTVSHVYEMFDTIDELNEQIAENNVARRAVATELKSTKDREARRRIRERLAEMPPFRRPVGPASKQRIRATLRSALTSACRNQKLMYNVAKDVELPSGRKPRPLVWSDDRVALWRRTGRRPGPVMVWTPRQTGAFLDAVEHDRLYGLWHLAAFRGLRRGELCGLHWEDVDLVEQSLLVQWQLVEVGWDTELTRPKSENSTRLVALDDETVAALERHRERQHADRRTFGSAWQETGLVFTQVDGAALHPAAVSSRFVDLGATAGVPPVRFHDLRHGAATLALSAGVELKVVQEMLGHSSYLLTADTYTSVLPELARAAAEAAASMVPRTRPGLVRTPRAHPDPREIRKSA